MIYFGCGFTSFEEFTTSLFITTLIPAIDFYTHEEHIPLTETLGCQDNLLFQTFHQNKWKIKPSVSYSK
jgi:hypothetical protein